MGKLVALPNWENPLEDVKKMLETFGRRKPHKAHGSLPFYKVEDLSRLIQYFTAVILYSGGYLDTANWEVDVSCLDFGFYMLTVTYVIRRDYDYQLV